MNTTTYDGSFDPHQWFIDLAGRLLVAQPIHTREWQSTDTSGSPAHATREIVNTTIRLAVPQSVGGLTVVTHPSLPWAEEHFAERVSGVPHNPPPSHVRWPYAGPRANADHMDGSGLKFAHTYPERLWARYHGVTLNNDMWKTHRVEHTSDETRVIFVNPMTHKDTETFRGTADGMVDWAIENGYATRADRTGIRERYGDLDDVVNLLISSPLTRQAFIPIWFPEDTGNHARVRVPCTIGYHVMIRNGQLHCWYYMRSCDLVRHLRNDVYMAGRLMQWLCDRLNASWNTQGIPEFHPMTNDVVPGELTMVISSLHAFVGDDWRVAKLARGDES